MKLTYIYLQTYFTAINQMPNVRTLINVQANTLYKIGWTAKPDNVRYLVEIDFRKKQKNTKIFNQETLGIS